jgi:hypothetical protein
MTARVQTQRFTTTGSVPGTGARPVGEFYVNFPDLRLGVINPSQSAQDLLPLRYFSPNANYQAGDFVSQASQLYIARRALTPNPFSQADWDPVLSSSASDSRYVARTGGTMTGPLTLSGSPTTALGAANKGYVDTNFLALTGGTLTGALSLPSAAPTLPVQATNKSYVDAQIATRLPLAGGTLTGPLTLSGNAASNLQAVPLQQLNSSLGNYLPLTGGTVTGTLSVNNAIRGNANVLAVATAGNASFSSYHVGNSSAVGFWNLSNTLWFGNTDGNGGPQTSRASLDVSGRFTANGGVAFESTGAFCMYLDGSNNRITNYSSGWYDAWVASNGTRTWAGPGGNQMTLDGSANLTVVGSITGASLNVGGGLVTAGNVNASGNVSGNNIISTSGLFQIAPNYYMQRGSDGYWRWVENGTTNMTLNTSGALNLRGGLTTGGDIHSGGGVYLADNTFGFFPGGSGRVFQFAGGWYWDWNGTSGDLRWLVNGNGTPFFALTPSNNNYVSNLVGPMTGIGLYVNFSDERAKANIVLSEFGLPEILRINPILFNRIREDGSVTELEELGFSAQQLQPVLPHAVRDGFGPDGDMLGVGAEAIVAALVNAIKTLNRRLASLEGTQP